MNRPANSIALLVLTSTIIGCTVLPDGEYTIKASKPKGETLLIKAGQPPVHDKQKIEILPESIRVAGVTIPKEQQLANMQLGQATVAAGAAPLNWPSSMAWKPRRHFGRFYLQSPHIRVTGSSGNWFFNDYFTDNPDSQWFAMYWPPGQLPVNDFETLHTKPPGGPQYVPGEIPALGSLHDTLFFIEQIYYSSRFGGSVAVVLRSLENYEYDLRSEEVEIPELSTQTMKVMESTLWDFSSTEMTLFVHPRPYAFNRSNAYNLVPRKATAVLVPDSAVAYTLRRTVSSAGTEQSSEIFSSNETPEQLNRALRAALQLAERNITNSTSIGQPASRFVHGFIHSEFQNHISTTHFIDMIEIADDYFMPYTHAKIPIITIQLRLPEINFDPLDDPLGIDITATIAAQRIYCIDCDNPVVPHTFHDLDNNEGTPFRTYAAFRLDQCNQVEGVIASVSIVEHDFPTPDEHYDTEFFNVPFSCETAQARYNNGVNPQLGLVEDPLVQEGWMCVGAIPDEGGVWCPNYGGTYTFESRVYLHEQ